MSKLADLLLREAGRKDAFRTLPVLAPRPVPAGQTNANDAVLSQFVNHLSKEEMRAVAVKLGLSHVLRPDDPKAKYVNILGRKVSEGTLQLQDILRMASADRPGPPRQPAMSSQGAGTYVQGLASSYTARALSQSQSARDEDDDDMLLLMEEDEMAGSAPLFMPSASSGIREPPPFAAAAPVSTQRQAAPSAAPGSVAQPAHPALAGSGARAMSKKLVEQEFSPAPALDDGAHYVDSDIEVDLSDSEAEEGGEGAGPGPGGGQRKQDDMWAKVPMTALKPPQAATSGSQQTSQPATASVAKSAAKQIADAKARLQVMPKASVGGGAGAGRPKSHGRPGASKAHPIRDQSLSQGRNDVHESSQPAGASAASSARPHAGQKRKAETLQAEEQEKDMHTARHTKMHQHVGAQSMLVQTEAPAKARCMDASAQTTPGLSSNGPSRAQAHASTSPTGLPWLAPAAVAHASTSPMPVQAAEGSQSEDDAADDHSARHHDCEYDLDKDTLPPEEGEGDVESPVLGRG